jgi:HindVP restriction endonuclease
MSNSGALYGINHTNRAGKDLWGKNQFNSAFPTALACYMRDHGHPAVCLTVKPDLTTECTDLSIDKLFNTEIPNNKLFFDFETKYTPYNDLVYGDLDRVDLVIREAIETAHQDGTFSVKRGSFLRALEVKLTVVPDSTTFKSDPAHWAPEIVIRPATAMYCALSMASNAPREEINKIFLPIGSKVMDWGNLVEAKQILPRAIEAINEFQRAFCSRQQPLIMQPIWRTKGKQPIMDDNAFDVFVWSDFALARVFTDLASASDDIVRYGRSVLRLAHYMYEYGRAGAGNISAIFSSMTYNQQSDKEFALNGTITRKYLRHTRMSAPLMSKDIVKNLILHGGEKNLSPERRFDQTIYFTYKFED